MGALNNLDFALARGTFPWQPILEANSAKLATYFIRHAGVSKYSRLQYRNTNFRKWQ